jgi:lipopolysaccharide transport system permease protein
MKNKTTIHLQRHQNIVFLLWALTYRNILSRYSKTILGPLWAIIQPLIYMAIFLFLRSVTKFSDEGIPYAIFTFSALVPWTFFSNAVIQTAPSIYLNANIIKKINSPREVFPLSAIVTSIFDLIISGFLLAGFMIWYGYIPDFHLLWLPILILLTSLLAFAIGLLLSAFGTYKRDFIIVTPFIMQFWLFLSPVMYPLSQVPNKLKTPYMLNPMVGIIEGFRNILLKDSNPPLEPLLWAFTVSFLILLLSWPIFRWMSQYFADVV